MESTCKGTGHSSGGKDVDITHEQVAGEVIYDGRGIDLQVAAEDGAAGTRKVLRDDAVVIQPAAGKVYGSSVEGAKDEGVARGLGVIAAAADGKSTCESHDHAAGIGQ